MTMGEWTVPRGILLDLTAREQIARGIDRKLTATAIGRKLGRHQSVISREILRNGGRDAYSAISAQHRADRLRARPQARKLESNQRLHDAVNRGLAQKWSPQQITRRLKRDYPDDEVMRVSHESIYDTLFVQARGECRTQLKLALRSGRTKRVPAGSTRPKQARIAGMVLISERPAEAADRAVPGHWESDLILGARNASQILTLVERSTRFVLLQKVPYDRRAERVALLLAECVQRLPALLWRSITHDQGVEMADHARFTLKTNIPVFFCDPHSPWQRGSNENTNGLLRQYFPKGTDLSVFSQAELDAVAAELNGRPRQTLDWATPAENSTSSLQRLLETTSCLRDVGTRDSVRLRFRRRAGASERRLPRLLVSGRRRC
jgi:transposase, IS30 family